MKALILFSGGLDSTVMLAMALAQKRNCLLLTFDYGQRHRIELEAAKKIAAHYQVPHRVFTLNVGTFAESSLIDSSKIVKGRTAEQIASQGIPSTYVPARNTLFLAYAVGQAELLSADEIYFGCNALDSNPYPDCTSSFVKAFQGVIDVATRQAAEGKAPVLIAPLIAMTKKQIVLEGMRLGAPLDLSFSCYDPNGSSPCRECDACRLREEGFTGARSELKGFESRIGL